MHLKFGEIYLSLLLGYIGLLTVLFVRYFVHSAYFVYQKFTFVDKTVHAGIYFFLLFPFGDFIIFDNFCNYFFDWGKAPHEFLGICTATGVIMVLNFVGPLLSVLESYKRYTQETYQRTLRRITMEILEREVGMDVGGVIISYCFE